MTVNFFALQESLIILVSSFVNRCQAMGGVAAELEEFCLSKIFSFYGINYFAEYLKYDRVLIPDMSSHIHCYCRTPVTATPSTPSTRTSRSAPRCSTSAGGGAADGRLCGSAKTVTPLKVDDDTW